MKRACTGKPDCKCAACDGTIEISCSEYRRLTADRESAVKVLRRAEVFIDAELEQRAGACFTRRDPEYKAYIAAPRALLNAISKSIKTLETNA